MKLYHIILFMCIGVIPLTWADQAQTVSEFNEQVLKKEDKKKDSDSEHYFDHKNQVVKKKKQ
jgi:hypothetical protein